MNILVTSGGTIEKIDEVRSISNMSTGRLGSLIADAFGAESSVEKVIYVCGKTAIRPKTVKAEVVPIGDVSDLEYALKKAFADTKIDIIVHSMAVSDYRIKSVTSAAALADHIASNLGSISKTDRESVGAEVASLLQSSVTDMRTGGKIGSDVDDMLLVMERTPKIIALFRSLAPQSTLVGFKLLHNAPQQALIDEGFRILEKNGCSFVLANNLTEITNDQHIGYIVDRGKNYSRYSTKSEIAAAIASNTIKERGAMH